jgi:hypothetical protein
MTYQYVWLVERYLRAPSEETLQSLATQTAAGIRSLRARRIEIEHLGSTAIAPEETCFCLFSAPSERTVEALNDLVKAPTLRVVSALLASPAVVPRGSQGAPRAQQLSEPIKGRDK